MLQAFVNFCWNQPTDRVINPSGWVSGPVGDFCRAADDGPGRNRIMNELLDALERGVKGAPVTLYAVLENADRVDTDEALMRFFEGLPVLETYGALQLVLAKLGLPPAWGMR